jgi:hypothetical protein
MCTLTVYHYIALSLGMLLQMVHSSLAAVGSTTTTKKKTMMMHLQDVAFAHGLAFGGWVGALAGRAVCTSLHQL